jgi:hypothetical protein
MCVCVCGRVGGWVESKLCVNLQEPKTTKLG